MLASVHAEKVPEGSSALRQAQDAATPPTEANAQLLWSTTEHGLCGEQSVTFTVHLDSKWHDYEIDLAANPKWKGLTDRLRFDPTDLAGVEFSVDEIRISK